ncbi:hypothetical protein P4S72_27005 [Vibrio sp. PP-XX7]
MNGELKTKAQGEKRGYPYVPDPIALKRATTVIVVESAINAFSAIAAFDPDGTGKGEQLPLQLAVWLWMRLTGGF